MVLYEPEWLGLISYKKMRAQREGSRSSEVRVDLS